MTCLVCFSASPSRNAIESRRGESERIESLYLNSLSLSKRLILDSRLIFRLAERDEMRLWSGQKWTSQKKHRSYPFYRQLLRVKMDLSANLCVSGNVLGERKLVNRRGWRYPTGGRAAIKRANESMMLKPSHVSRPRCIHTFVARISHEAAFRTSSPGLR